MDGDLRSDDQRDVRHSEVQSDHGKQRDARRWHLHERNFLLRHRGQPRPGGLDFHLYRPRRKRCSGLDRPRECAERSHPYYLRVRHRAAIRACGSKSGPKLQGSARDLMSNENNENWGGEYEGSESSITLSEHRRGTTILIPRDPDRPERQGERSNEKATDVVLVGGGTLLLGVAPLAAQNSVVVL